MGGAQLVFCSSFPCLLAVFSLLSTSVWNRLWVVLCWWSEALKQVMKAKKAFFSVVPVKCLRL